MSVRSRTRGSIGASIAAPEIQSKWVDCTSNWTHYGYDAALPHFGDIEIMSDVVVPGFKRRSSNGEVFFNPMSKRREIYSASSGSSYHIRRTVASCSPPQFAEWRRVGNSFPSVAAMRPNATANVVIPAVSLIDDLRIEDAITEASTRAFSNVGKSNSNLYETVAEANQVLGLYNQTLEQAGRVISKIPRKALMGSTNAYLLYRYGMRPVIEDVNNIVKALDVISQRVRSTARGSVGITESRSEIHNIPFHGYLNVMMASHDTDSVTVRAMVLQEYLLTRANASGFTTKGLLTLPWELIPYSFVVDMFINVGDLIGSYLPSPGYNQLGSCVTVERTLHTINSAVNTVSTSSEWTLLQGITGSTESIVQSKTRSAIGSPGLVVTANARMPNLQRALDLTALTVQRLLIRR